MCRDTVAALTTGLGVRKRHRLPRLLPPHPPLGDIPRATQVPLAAVGHPLGGTLEVLPLKIAMTKRLLEEDETRQREVLGIAMAGSSTTRSGRISISGMSRGSSSCNGTSIGSNISDSNSSSMRRRQSMSGGEEKEGLEADRKGGGKLEAETTISTPTPTHTPTTTSITTPTFTTDSMTKAMRVFHTLLGGVVPGAGVEVSAAAMVMMVVGRPRLGCSPCLLHLHLLLLLPPLLVG